MKKFPLAAFVLAAAIFSLLWSTGTTTSPLHQGGKEEHGNMLDELVAVTAPATALPRTGWTATASDEELVQKNAPASSVLDGNEWSIWHSKFYPSTVPLPHWITLDMKATQPLSGTAYLPRQDTSPNGIIGQYSISVSNDNVNWGSPVATGSWADDRSLKTVMFTASGRYVRLTALTEAGNRVAWTSAAEVYALGGQPTTTTTTTQPTSTTQPPTTQPPASTLPRTGWTATASDEETVLTNAPASNVLDGNNYSIWHSRRSAPAAPLPHWITLDMKSAKLVQGITYVPRQDTSDNGFISDYSISLSSDGTNLGNPVATGTWANTRTNKTVSFGATTARYMRLTALGEAGNNVPWTTAAEIYVLGTSPNNPAQGTWGAPINFPIVPVSAVVLPNNKLLTFSGYRTNDFNIGAPNTYVSILDLNTGVAGPAQNINVTHQMFCPGLTLLADGRLLVDGGSTDSATSIYNFANNTWTKGPLMKIPRAYQSTTLLSTGEAFSLGGSWVDHAGGKDGEVFTPSGTTGTRRLLPGVSANNILTDDPRGVYRADNHPWLFATSNGGVFHAGPSKQMNWITTSGNGTITPAGNRSTSDHAMNGNAVMYDIGRIFTVGGSTAYDNSAPANKQAYTIDINGGPTQPVVTRRVSDMSWPRAFNNSAVLPDGKVLVVGGQQFPKAFTDTGAVQNPELWDPATGNFTVMAPENNPRTYHSVATLLPDGRVFSGGGGLCGACATNHQDGQIFTPPYLLDANGNQRIRPEINSAPTTAAPGATISVTTNSATPRFALVRTSSATHSVNTDQRRIPLTPVTTNGTTYTLQIPADRGTTLPGYYMLFAMNADGTPSVSKFIRIS